LDLILKKDSWAIGSVYLWDSNTAESTENIETTIKAGTFMI
jgi:hypothetical protein